MMSLQSESADVSVTTHLDMRVTSSDSVAETIEQHGVDNCDNDGLAQSGLAAESADSTAVLHGQSVEQSKVFSSMQATLSSDVMCTIVSMNCWDMLVTAANACCIQLLHTADDSICIAVGYTLHGFCELERILLSLLSGTAVTSKQRPHAIMLQLSGDYLSSWKNPLSSLAPSHEDSRCVDTHTELFVPEPKTSSPPSKGHSERPDCKPSLETSRCDAHLQLNTDVQATTQTKKLCHPAQLVTRSGRPVKPKIFAGFTLTGENSLQRRGGMLGNQTTLRRRQDRPQDVATSDSSGDVKHTDTSRSFVVEEAKASVCKQDATEFCQQQLDEMSNHDDTASNTAAEDDEQCQKVGEMESRALYNGRTRLESREYEALMPYRFFCTHCSFKSKREGHMKKHLKLHARGVAVLQCQGCSYRTVAANHLTRHTLRHHSKNSVSCGLSGCGYVASSKQLMEKHVASRHPSPSQTVEATFLPCPVTGCSYKARTETRLARHTAKHRALKVDDEALDFHLVERYQCSKCSYETNRREHFRRHVDSVHSNLRRFLCEVCGRRFKRRDGLLQHSAVVHSDESGSRQMRPHHCSICQRTFCSKSHLSDHMSVHSSSRSFVCEVCGARFKTKAVHRKHLLSIHMEPGAHACHVCGRLFNTSFAVKRHSRLHQLQINSVDVAAASQTPCTFYIQQSTLDAEGQLQPSE